jgi:hypothetical protein
VSQKSGSAKVLTLGRSPDKCGIFALESFQERGKSAAKKNLQRKKAEKQQLQGTKKGELSDPL